MRYAFLLFLCACGRDLTAPVVSREHPTCAVTTVVVDTLRNAQGVPYETVTTTVTAFYAHCPPP